MASNYRNAGAWQDYDQSAAKRQCLGGGQGWAASNQQQQYGQQDQQYGRQNGYQSQQQQGYGQQQAQRPQQEYGQQNGQRQGSTQGAEVYIAYLRHKDDQVEVSVQTLLGEYEERGTNSGRKVFQKLHTQSTHKGGRPVDVLLYYWDARDGDKYEGWWFGNKLGGSQVWAHCKSSAMTPPVHGWQIPWNGYPRPEFALMTKEEKINKDLTSAVKSLSEKAEVSTVEVDQLIDQAQAVCADIDHAPRHHLVELESLLSPQVENLSALDRRISETATQANEPLVAPQILEQVKALSHVGAALRTKKDALVDLYSKIKSTRQQQEEEENNRSWEESDASVLEFLLPEATEKLNLAEDLTEKAKIVLEMMHACGEDEDFVKKAIDQTEAAGKSAQMALGEARLFLSNKLNDTKNFAPKAKERAVAELTKMQNSLKDLQSALAPAVAVRQDHQRGLKVKRVLAENEEALAQVDLGIDRAEEAVVILREDLAEDSLEAAKRSIDVADQKVDQVIKRVESKASEVGEALKEKLAERQGRMKLRLADLRKSVKEVSEQVTANAYVNESTQKCQNAEKAVSKIEEEMEVVERIAAAAAEGASRPDDWESKARSPEALAASAASMVSTVKTFLQMKAVEIKRFSAKVVEDFTQRTQLISSNLEELAKKVEGLKASSAERRRELLLQDTEGRIKSAEALVKEVAEATRIFMDADDASSVGGLPADMSAEDIREVAKQASIKERRAMEALAEVRKALAARQIECKKENVVKGTAMLLTLTQRTNKTQKDLEERRKRVGSVEQRLAARKALEDARHKVEELEAKVTEAVSLSEGLPEESTGQDGSVQMNAEGAAALKKAEVLCKEAQLAARMTARMLESQARLQGFCKAAIAALEPRVDKAQSILEGADRLLRDRSEREFVSGLLSEVRLQSAACAEKVDEASKLEPSGEAGDAANAAKQALMFERAIQAAQTVQSQFKTCVAMKRLALKRLSDGSAMSAHQELDEAQEAVDTAGSRLSSMRAALQKARAAVPRN